MRELYPTLLLLAGLTFSVLSSEAQSNLYLHFDGIDDYTSLPAASQYIYNSNTITMAGWFYTDALVYGQGMMSIRGGGSGAGEMYVIQLSNGILECRVVTSTGLHEVVGPAGTIVAGQWQHVAWVFDVNQVRLYIDGNLVGTGNASGTFGSNDRPFTIGKSILSGLNFVFGGRSDEVSLWNTALDQAAIQDMMTNELTGNESGLVVYYKFNQGTPGGDNSTITQVNAFGGQTAKNADLVNFALTGATSNFNGSFDSSFQTVSIPPVPNKLISDAPFVIPAIASSGLPVTLEVASGPASIVGDSVVLNGTAGEVTVKASQAGDASFAPAEDVYATFNVLDPAQVLVEAEVLHPLEGAVHAPDLMPVPIAVRATIAYPDLFAINSLTVKVDNDTVLLTDHDNGFFTGWWTPDQNGAHIVEVIGENNYEASSSTTVSIDLTDTTSNTVAKALDSAWVYSDVASVTMEAELPSYVGAYTKIIGNLNIECPAGGCDPWDRVSSIEVQGKDGNWYEIVRYLTPYGVACQSNIDLTDFKSLLLGKTRFRVNLTTFANGFLYTLDLHYTAGIDTVPYSHVGKLWYDTYPFGDMADLQPTDTLLMPFPPNTTSAKIKLVSTGHGWGNNNTSNAAEFSQNTHHIWVNGAETFTQLNWRDCNPNPDACQPQLGTWYFDRAGWCPGSIAQFFDYDMSPYVGDSVDLRYVFDEGYTDFCHPNNPNCVTGSTCADCNDGFNPHLIVSSYLISYGNEVLDSLSVDTMPIDTMPMDTTPVSLTRELRSQEVSLYPNPSVGNFFVEVPRGTPMREIRITDYAGRLLQAIEVEEYVYTVSVDLGKQPAGVYFVTIRYGETGRLTKRLIIE